MNSINRKLALLLALCVIVCLFPGCGGNDEPADTGGGSQDVSQTPSASPSHEPSGGSGAGEEAEPETEIVLPLTEEKVTFTYWMSGEPFLMAYNLDLNEVTYYREMEARTNVRMEITSAPFFAAEEQFNIMIGSGDYFHLINGFETRYKSGADDAIEQEIVVELGQYLDTLMPNYKKAMSLYPRYVTDSYTDEGNLVSANCFFTQTEGVTIGGQMRADWLEAVGIDVPVTYQDYEDALTAFKVELGKFGSYGLYYYGVEDRNFMCGGFVTAGYYGSSATGDPFLNISGTVEFAPINDGYREYLDLMAKWFAEDLIDPNYMAQTSGVQDADVLSDKISFRVIERDKFGALYQQTEDPNFRLTGVPSPVKNEGDEVHISFSQAFVMYGTAVSTSCPDIDLALRWLDYCYTDEATLLANYGIEGESLTYDESGNPMLTDLVISNPDMSTIAATVAYNKYGGPQLNDARRYWATYGEDALRAIEYYEIADDAYVFPQNASLSADDNSEYSRIMNDIKTYVMELTNNVIMGGTQLNDSTWEEYKSTVESLGIARAAELKQKSLDNYLARGN